MDMPLTQSLERIISERGERAKALDGRISEWMAVSDELRRLGAAIQDLSAHPASPGALVGLLPQIENLPARIEREVLPRLRRVQQRFSRSTLNIGVAGEARMGKSTLLQAISGLGEDQIPTGDDLPVTAVRSRIFHVQGSGRARIGFHSWETFRSSVLQPYFARLGADTAPPSAEAMCPSRKLKQ